jgi:DNA polymerase-3 subunit beta
MLSSVLLTLEKNTLRFITTDLDITIISLQETKEAEPGKVAVPMKQLFSIVRELPPGEITIEKSKNTLLISCEKIKFKVNTLNPEEFPQTRDSKGVSLIKIIPQELEEMIRLTSFCVGREDSNYVLGGILFEIDENKIKLVSTDGKRLSFIQRRLPPKQPEVASKITFILPAKAVSEIYKLIKDKKEDLYLSVEENRVGFDLKNIRFIARPIEGEFPNYAQYIPQEGKDKLIVNRKNLLFALKRASLLSTTDYQGVKLELKKDSLNIYKSTPQLGEVREVVDARYNGAHLEIGFNPGYLVDALKNLSDKEISVDFFGADKPAVLRKEDYIYLLLPVKL